MATEVIILTLQGLVGWSWGRTKVSDERHKEQENSKEERGSRSKEKGSRIQESGIGN